MKKSRFTKSQIVAVLKEGEAGIAPGEISRKHGISRATYFNWRSKYGGVTVNELKRMKELESENSKLNEALKAERTKPDDQSELLFRKGREFEASYLEELKRLHPGAGDVVEIADPFKDPTKAVAETLAAMRAGVSIIYQATSIDGDLLRSLSLFRCDQSSRHLLQDSHTALLEELKGRIIEG